MNSPCELHRPPEINILRRTNAQYSTPLIRTQFVTKRIQASQWHKIGHCDS